MRLTWLKNWSNALKCNLRLVKNITVRYNVHIDSVSLVYQRDECVVTNLATQIIQIYGGYGYVRT